MIRSARDHPAVLSWRRACAHDPVTYLCGIMVWYLAAGWLLPAFRSQPGSLIARFVDLSVPIGVVRACLVGLVLLGAAGLFGCWRTVSLTFAAAIFVWWGLIEGLAVQAEIGSTSNFAYGGYTILAWLHLRGVLRRRRACAAPATMPT